MLPQIRRKHRLNIHHISQRAAKIHISLSSNNADGNQFSKSLTDEEKQQRRLIEQYIFSKLEVYANKSRIWQITHSKQIKRRLLDKTRHISDLYSLPVEFVRECINQLFIDVDKHVAKAREFIQTTTRLYSEPNGFFLYKMKSSHNQWNVLQLKRAQQIFPDVNRDDYNDDEFLQKYYKYIFENLTPKPDTNSTNCVAQLRERPFDLDNAYEQAERTGKDYLKQLLDDYHQRPIPDLPVIQEMVNLGLEYMKMRPTDEEFIGATNFLSKIAVLHKSKQAYESGLRNMGDDFMLLRFGKIFGPNALPTTDRANNQFIYLVHLFMKSISQFLLLIRSGIDEPNEMVDTIQLLVSSILANEIKPPIMKLPNEDILAPEDNIDQWTWLLEKWRDALRTFPMLLIQVGAFARLLRTTVGIGIARLFNFAETMVNTNEVLDHAFMSKELFHALQMGYYFGIAYAVVDCVQDEMRNFKKIPLHHIAALNPDKESNENLSPVEIIDKWLLIMEQLLCGGEYDRKKIPKTPLTPLLLETFDSLVTLTKTINATCSSFNELALLLRSQRMDKKVPNEFYDDEELFLGAMLKSHFTYTCTTYLGNIKSAREESERLWIMPFLGQLTDDCRDFYDDITSNSVTSYTHYAAFIGRHPTSDKHLLNPFYAFLYLCTDLYLTSNRDIQTGAFIGRRILRTLKAIELSAGESALREFLHIFCQDNRALHDYCWIDIRSQFPNVSDPEKAFFRVVSKESVEYGRTNRKLETYVGDHLKDIEDSLEIQSFSKSQKTVSISERDEKLLLSAMNYSVTAGGKRLRPLMMLMISDLYRVDIKNVLPLACGIEYLHTSSLIFDDLPAQDNSDLRRGRPTLHRAVIDNDIPLDLCEGRAQLAAVDLIAVSMSLINHDLVKNGFSPERVNQVVSEISLSMHDLCIGQMMDLRAAHVGIEQGNGQLDELDRIAWLKTGKAIEVVLITPVILNAPLGENLPVELNRIRELGRLMGILFQMRDDLLDVEGENIGKPAALDVKNNTVTYVSTLGVEGTRRRLKEFRRETLKLVDECWPVGAGTIKDVVNYIVDRKN